MLNRYTVAATATALLLLTGCASNGQLQADIARAQATADEALAWAKNAKHDAVDAGTEARRANKRIEDLEKQLK